MKATTILLILDFVHVGVNYTDLPQTILNQRYPLPNGSRYHLVSSVSNFLHLSGTHIIYKCGNSGNVAGSQTFKVKKVGALFIHECVILSSFGVFFFTLLMTLRKDVH